MIVLNYLNGKELFVYTLVIDVVNKTTCRKKKREGSHSRYSILITHLMGGHGYYCVTCSQQIWWVLSPVEDRRLLHSRLLRRMNRVSRSRTAGSKAARNKMRLTEEDNVVFNASIKISTGTSLVSRD
jgi:hypothetical protein